MLPTILSPAQNPVPAEYVQGYQGDMVQVCVVFLLYGVQFALSLAAIPVLARKDGRIWVLALALAVLFTSSTLATAIRFSLTWNVFGFSQRKAVTVALMFTILSCINYVISDALVVWRAWVMWPDTPFVRGVLMACMMASFFGVALEIVSQTAAIEVPFGLPLVFMAVSLCLTNFVATSLIGIRFWIYRRDVSAWLAPQSTGIRVGGVLLLLIESGVVYTVLWAINVLVQVRETLEHYYHFAGDFEIMHETFYLCAGIYPTFVVVVVTLQQHSNAETIVGGQGSFLESLHFASGCDGDRPDGDNRRNSELEGLVAVRRAPLGSERSSTIGTSSEEVQLTPRSET